MSLKLFGIEVQAYYHGGSLHGKDVQKLMSNASNKFKSFADTLKKCKKDDCKLRDKEIDDICQSYANLCVLWDCAFSFASKKGPMKNDIVMPRRFCHCCCPLACCFGVECNSKSSSYVETRCKTDAIDWRLGLQTRGLGGEGSPNFKRDT